MLQLIQAVALVLVLGWAATVQAAGKEIVPDPAAEAAATAFAADGTPLEWFIVGTCLCVSLGAGGYMLHTYLRRRDALSTLAAMEERHFRSDSGFGRG